MLVLPVLALVLGGAEASQSLISRIAVPPFLLVLERAA
jgi:hypothetical protein